jgi:two-component system, OmpR family, response regulator
MNMSSDQNSDPGVRDDEVFALTAGGEKQLKDSETSLARLELELLVLVNGTSSVAQIRARVPGTPAAAVTAALDALRAKEMIFKAQPDAPAPQAGDIGVGDFLKTGAFYVPPMGPTPEYELEANEGASYLQKQGYYVRIARRAPLERKPGAGGRFKVVIIEDEPHLAKLLRSFFAIEGFDTLVASNRTEIVEALRKPPVPELLLLDVVLPDADGFDILGELRQHAAFKHSAIVMLTAKATREAVLRGLAGGADGYVTKPFEMDVLMKAVRAVLGMQQV